MFIKRQPYLHRGGCRCQTEAAWASFSPAHRQPEVWRRRLTAYHAVHCEGRTGSSVAREWGRSRTLVWQHVHRVERVIMLALSVGRPLRDAKGRVVVTPSWEQAIVPVLSALSALSKSGKGAGDHVHLHEVRETPDDRTVGLLGRPE